ncbi:MAG: SBBP repeat-containing protein [Bacteroidota bacterium]|nr:SBBP repeat-containing protein [Bacteroidota bacterium]
MKKLLLSISFLIGASTLSAQSFTWAKNMGGTSLDNGLSVAVDASGNVYTTGYFQGTADFDPGAGVSNLTSLGGTDIFISKLNAAGNFVWVKQLGGTNYDYARSIAVSSTGNVYITGYFVGTADFDPGAGTFNLMSSGFDEVFVSKLDASGNFIWAKQMGGSSNDYGYSIAVDASENVYIAGGFQGTSDFDPSAAVSNLTSTGNYDIFISKLNLNGNFVWAKNMGSTAQDMALCITLDPPGNVLTSGYFEGTADFDPSAATYTLSSVNARDVFVSKLSSAGNFVWAKQIGGPGNQIANSIVTDASGNVYTTGSFENSADFDPNAGAFGMNSDGATDIFISKLNQSGLFGFAKRIGSIGFDYGRGITLDASGNVLTTGEFYDTVDFDPGVATNSLVGLSPSSDAYISKLDGNGNFISAKSMGSASGSAIGNAIVSDAASNIYTTGYFSGTTDFDPNAGVFNLTPPGTQPDVFVLKMNSLSTGVIETTFGIVATIYPNPVSSMLTIQTEETIETVTVYNLLGAIVMEEKSNSFSVEQISKGVYTLQIKTVKGISTARFIKE